MSLADAVATDSILTAAQKESLDNPPASNMKGVFPQNFLNKQEKVFFESRPSAVSFIVKPIVTGIIVLLLFVAPVWVLLGNASSAAFGGAFITSFLLFWTAFWVFFFVILPILFGILRWIGTKYAITDRRVIFTYGLLSRRSSDIPLDKVMNTNLIQPFFERIFGYGTLAFTTAGSGSLRIRSLIRSGAVVWRAVRDPLQVRNYVQETMDSVIKMQKARDYQEMARTLKGTNAQS